jgi:surfeit locus 1 family protein
VTDAQQPRHHSRFWLLSIATVLAVGATVSLGRWQLSRAAEKELYQANVEARGQEAILSAQALLDGGKQEALIHRRIEVRGQWLADKTVFLDNRQMNAKPGFYVLTPLQLEGRSEVVLVQRGWVARNFMDRALLPPILSPAGGVTVTGRIAQPPSKLYELGHAQANIQLNSHVNSEANSQPINPSGVIRQNLDWAQFKAETNLNLLPLSIQQQGAPSEGLLREWPQPASGIDKHYGYAFQWFGLSALITLLYVWFQLVKRFIAPQPK